MSLVTACIVVAVLYALTGPVFSEEKQRTYVGTAKCKTCHKTAAQGEQFTIWEKSKHAKAFEALAGEDAKKIAQERGIEDPQTAAECLKCHVTAHGVDKKFLGEKFAATDGVGCESCHGAGGDFYKSKTMKAIASGEIEPASVGLVMPDKETCLGCHNEESPTFEGFEYEEMIAKIAHPIPEERKAKYKVTE
ncbi:MAG: cytochrome C554 [Candidatus Latescibacterota bacterium]|nr:MAG: cytochrome C554 [Candidatus Latescibacterota bacterium]